MHAHQVDEPDWVEYIPQNAFQRSLLTLWTTLMAFILMILVAIWKGVKFVGRFAVNHSVLVLSLACLFVFLLIGYRHYQPKLSNMYERVMRQGWFSGNSGSNNDILTNERLDSWRTTMEAALEQVNAPHHVALDHLNQQCNGMCYTRNARDVLNRFSLTPRNATAYTSQRCAAMTKAAFAGLLLDLAPHFGEVDLAQLQVMWLDKVTESFTTSCNSVLELLAKAFANVNTYLSNHISTYAESYKGYLKLGPMLESSGLYAFVKDIKCLD